MSMSSNQKNTSTTATVVEKDSRHVRVKYLDPIARPDLEGKVSGFLPSKENYSVGDIVAIDFKAAGRLLGQIIYRPYISEAI